MLQMEQGDFYNNAVFWVETDRISPNPFQPRREFDEAKLADLAESIRQYGILQPLVVTRQELQRADGGISVEYELLAGERRLRASKMAAITQVPVLIRATEDTDKMKLEIAIIENLQREDLNAIDRAKAFKQLIDEFKMKHADIAKKVAKSREYVSNTLRLLMLPETMQQALINKQIAEGHTRPLLMLIDRPEEQVTLFKEITIKKMTVREAERAARGIATDRARKQDLPPELAGLEKELTESLGTRVQIETRENGGKVRIDFFSEDDIRNLLKIVKSGQLDTLVAQVNEQHTPLGEQQIQSEQDVNIDQPQQTEQSMPSEPSSAYQPTPITESAQEYGVHTQETFEEDSSEMKDNHIKYIDDDPEDDLYSIKNFSI